MSSVLINLRRIPMKENALPLHTHGARENATEGPRLDSCDQEGATPRQGVVRDHSSVTLANPQCHSCTVRTFAGARSKKHRSLKKICLVTRDKLADISLQYLKPNDFISVCGHLNSYEKVYQAGKRETESFHSLTLDNPQCHSCTVRTFAGARFEKHHPLKKHAVGYVAGDMYYGINVSLNMWAPMVSTLTEFSLSQIWIIFSSFGGDLNTTEVGWQDTRFIKCQGRDNRRR